ncbi:MAG TPA: 23S rRNA (pseudouridine(1915)-N(3))-methyltransferase RlmH [bacterium]|nr:23S rRNA (pseudouridine(1915)-N(3))-methyltransferase RlmH [bacterium]
MLTILIVSDGSDHFKGAIDEYIKRLGSDLRIETIRPERKRTDPSGIISAETDRIIEFLEKHPRLMPVLLDERGIPEHTRGLSARLVRWRVESVKPCFVIGGAYGVDRTRFPDCPVLRLSDLVMPHSLALLVLLEQLYRCREIDRGSGYHHQ